MNFMKSKNLSFVFFRLMCLAVFVFCCFHIGNAQSNPTPQSLPYTQNFNSYTGSSNLYLPGWQGWTITGAISTAFPTAPPASNQAQTSGTNATTTSGIFDFNGKIGFMNLASAMKSFCLAINTSGYASIQVSYLASTQRTQPSDRIGAIGLQYRLGSSGTFVDVGTSYQNINSVSSTSGTGSINPTTINVNLPVSCDNLPQVQLRWVYKDVSGIGGRPSFSIDNVSIVSTAPNCLGIPNSPLASFNGSSNICFGTNKVMTANGFSNYSGLNTQWKVSSISGGPYSNVSGGIGSTTSTFTTSVLPAGTYYYICTSSCNSSGLVGTSNEIALTVNPLPNVIISAPYGGAFCGTQQIAASGATAYTWTPGTSLSSTTGSLVTFTGNSGVTVNVTGTDTNGCVGTAAQAIIYTASAAISMSSTESNFCGTGGTATISASSSVPYSYEFSALDGAVLSNITASTVDATVSQTSAIRVTGTDVETGCAAQATYSVGLYPLPTATLTTTASSVCPGTPASINSGLSAGNFSADCIPVVPLAIPPTASYLANNGAMSVALTSGNSDDGGWDNIPLGFNFNFFGTSYNTLNVGTNGILQFGAYNATDFSLFGGFFNLPVPNTYDPLGAIYVCANDLDPSIAGTPATYIRYWTEGYAPNRKFVIEYRAYQFVSTTNIVNVQAILYETLGTVDIVALEIASTSDKSIGVNSPTGTVGATAPNCAASPNTANYWFGQNATIPAAAPQAWRFSPPSNYSTQWSATDVNGTYTLTNNLDGSAINTTNGFSATVAPLLTTQYSISYANTITGCSNSLNPSEILISVLGILTQPSNAFAILGGAAQINCLAPIGATYQWQSYNNDQWVNLFNAGQYSGVNTSSLNVSNVNSNNYDQWFRCLVTSSQSLLCQEYTDSVAIYGCSVFQENFQIATSEDSICFGNGFSAELVGLNDSTSFFNNNLLYVPDDQTQCFSSSILVSGFSNSETIQSASDIESLAINFEHSYMGDLVITYICPNGQSLIVHQQGGAVTHLGEPVDILGPTDPTGVGYDYFWSPTATAGTWQAYISSNPNDTILPNGTYNSVEPFSNLIGCPVNGLWTIEFCDLWASDDGWLFNWGVNFNSVVSTATSDSIIWQGNDLVWDDGNGNALFYPNQYGSNEYSVSAILSNGCVLTDSITIQAVGPNIILTPEINACSLPITLNASVEGGNNNAFSWSYINDPTVLSQTDLLTPTILSQPSYNIYELIVSSDYSGGLQCSDTATVSVNLIEATILQQPNSVDANIGDVVYFSCLGSVGLSYQWQILVNGIWTNLNDTGQFNGVTTSQMSVSNVNVGNGNQQFQCVVTSPDGACTEYSNSVTLYICDIASSSIPAVLNIALNTSPNISISPVNNNASYQWQSNIGFGWVNTSDGADYSGSTTANLTLINSDWLNDNQWLQCVVTSDICSDTTNICVVHITPTGIDETELGSIYYYEDAMRFSQPSNAMGENYYVFDGNGRLITEGKYFGENYIELNLQASGVYCFRLKDKIIKFIKI